MIDLDRNFDRDRDRDLQREERAIYAIIIAALLPVVVAALYRGGAEIDGGTTLSFLIAALGLLGLGAGIRAMRARLPRARVHRPRAPRAREPRSQTR
ncbi:MAG TPA: hypothetical protein VNO30_38260 [Kofleriaceae bacterium]|nr:hypothetical protein [Kofleriaceae bacterium]